MLATTRRNELTAAQFTNRTASRQCSLKDNRSHEPPTDKSVNKPNTLRI